MKSQRKKVDMFELLACVMYSQNGSYAIYVNFVIQMQTQCLYIFDNFMLVTLSNFTSNPTTSQTSQCDEASCFQDKMPIMGCKQITLLATVIQVTFVG